MPLYISSCLQTDLHSFLFRSPAGKSMYYLLLHNKSPLDPLQSCVPLPHLLLAVVALTVGKDPPRELFLGLLCTLSLGLPLDPTASGYAPSKNPLSFLSSDRPLAYMLPSDMAEDHQVKSGHLLALETAVAKMAHQNKMNFSRTPLRDLALHRPKT